MQLCTEFTLDMVGKIILKKEREDKNIHTTYP